jgi:hypothetical protein
MLLEYGRSWRHVKLSSRQSLSSEACPVFPNAKNSRHWSFLDPSKAQGTESEQLKIYRAVHDAVQQKIEEELFVKDRNRKP